MNCPHGVATDAEGLALDCTRCTADLLARNWKRVLDEDADPSVGQLESLIGFLEAIAEGRRS